MMPAYAEPYRRQGAGDAGCARPCSMPKEACGLEGRVCRPSRRGHVYPPEAGRPRPAPGHGPCATGSVARPVRAGSVGVVLGLGLGFGPAAQGACPALSC